MTEKNERCFYKQISGIDIFMEEDTTENNLTRINFYNMNDDGDKNYFKMYMTCVKNEIVGSFFDFVDNIMDSELYLELQNRQINGSSNL